MFYCDSATRTRRFILRFYAIDVFTSAVNSGSLIMATNQKPRLKDAAMRRYKSVVLVTLLGALLFILLIGTNPFPKFVSQPSDGADEDVDLSFGYSYSKVLLSMPKQSELSIRLEKLNQLPPRNLDLYPKLAQDHITIVLYVHNRPQYLQVVIGSLSKVIGISETLLIVSHDGYFEEMDKLVKNIRFCQVKQIFAPYSPHLFPDSFPGASPADCKGKDDAITKHCKGNPDQYGNHRSPKIVSLKHHWWWMMNTVWDGLKERQSSHVFFIEEDHFILPNAYRNLQILTSMKPRKCPDCYSVNLAPSDVKSRGDGGDFLVAERMGNIGYAFNWTVWRKIHKKALEFCFFDDYNWDITMWATVYPSFGSPVYSLRGPWTSAVHFGKCGLHQGQGEMNACIDNGMLNIEVRDIDKAANINPEWQVQVLKDQPGYGAGFKGWGGWGDQRDRRLCLNFARMYHSTKKISPF